MFRLALFLLLTTAVLAEDVVSVVFRTNPPGATVSDSHQVLGRAGDSVPLDLDDYRGEVRLVLEAPDYLPLLVKVNPSDLRGAVYPSEREAPLALQPRYFWVPYRNALQRHWLASATVAVVGAMGLWVGVGRMRRSAHHHRTLVSLHAQAKTDDSLIMARLGRYRVVERLGAGGMARVYRGVPEDRLDQESESVALKLLHREFWENEDQGLRFQREVQAYQQLNHPAICRLIDWDEQDGLQYLVLEYVRGTTLRTLLDKERVTSHQATVFLLSLLEALGHAHSRGIVHRDLKPENVMVTPSGALKVMDFGLARVHNAGTLTRTGTVMGTPHYMSPEQISDMSTVGPATDQYALGVIAYEMYTGALPFESQDPVQIIFKQLSEAPPPMRLRSNAPVGIEGIVGRMLAKEPGMRFPNLAAVAEALRSARRDGVA